MTPVLRILFFSWVGATVATASAPEIISVRKIWDRALSGWVAFPIRRPFGLRPNRGKSREKRTQSE